MTFIEAPELIKSNASSQIVDQCLQQGFAVSGNANGKQGEDMEGYAYTAQAIQMGVFTNGWIGLGFCAASSIVGILGVLWFSKEEKTRSFR